MSKSTPTYDIFISYAHADALTAAGKSQVKEIKQSIEDALQRPPKGTKTKTKNTRRESRVFLDSEALKWGCEWNARIRESLQKCKVFVYLLSPNYIKSDYCQREKLWWAKKEIDNGRLNKGVRPIYYIRLKETGDPKEDEYIKELKICQAHDRAFFQNLEEIRNELNKKELSKIARKIRSCLNKEQKAVNSFSSIHPSISNCFVGRLNDLARLNDLVFTSRRIPVIAGGRCREERTGCRLRMRLCGQVSAGTFPDPDGKCQDLAGSHEYAGGMVQSEMQSRAESSWPAG